uniref:Ribosomal protein S19 n=1 Tax=Dictyopteris divaricata TaxID=156996 RepID=A0A4Y5T7H4_9PHAE|nr:ribosomal protein S19 [Dictyopteris divaricata]QDB64127.1 ribosomal protein S19 [Dictyopteris divaricata]
MTRSKWKLPFIDKNIFKYMTLKHKNPKIWSRRSTIYPAAVGQSFLIYNGKEMIKREIKTEMVGHKIGEFVPTRKTFLPPQKKRRT